jgi:hypothetical protein
MKNVMKGNITISRFSNYREEDDKSVSISIEDEASGTRFIEVRMTPRDFMLALTGQGYVDVDFELRADLVGKRREIKTENIPVSDYSVSDDEIEEVLAAYEVDGWRASRGDLKNHHNHIGDEDGRDYYSVGFIRYLDPE